MKTLGVNRKIGPLGTPLPEPFKSNNVKNCLVCDVEITELNDSGWEFFTEDGCTQPVCKKCDKESANWELVTLPKM